MKTGLFNCTYIPVEIIKAAGLLPARTIGDEPVLEKAEAYLHRNLCAFCRQAFDRCLSEIEKSEALCFIAPSCDSSRKLAETLKHYHSEKTHILEIPRHSTEPAIELLSGRYRQLAKKLQISEAKLEEAINWANNIRREIKLFLKKFENSETPKWSQFQKILNRIWEFSAEELRKELSKIETFTPEARVLVAGGLVDKPLLFEFFEDLNVLGINETCGGIRPFTVEVSKSTNPYWALAEAYLKRVPCARNSGGVQRRFDFIKNLISSYRIHGIVYHTIKFCELYGVEQAIVSKKLEGFPFVFIETDYSSLSIGQIRTRIEAFVESIIRKKKPFIISKKPEFFAGIDSGSTSTNMVIIDREKNIVGFKTIPTGASSLKTSQRVFEELTSHLKLPKEKISYIVATGYGRVVIPFANEIITEISCHAKGTHHLFPQVRTIIDIGGQDSKVIRINEKGDVIKFVMNDKCAAGTGRFLEVMSKVLQVPLDEMGKLSLEATEVVPITSICTVFAESEVISLIAEGKPTSGILAGVHSSIASRVVSMMERIGKEPEYAMTGGVARNIGVVKAIESRIGRKLLIHSTPEIVGALGAALFAYESVLV